MIIINNASYSNVSVTYTADGTQREFSFPFDYLRKAFVKVEVNEEIILVQGTDYTVSDNKTVVLTEAPESGTIVRVFRETSTTRLVSWADASVLRAKDMTIQQVQNLHILEEQQYWVTENAIIRQGKEWNARNFPIKNVGDPVDPKDATNKEYVDDKVEYVDNNFMKLDDNGDYWVGRGKTIRDIEEPIRQSDGATKNYVDHVLAGLSITGDRVQTFNSVALMKEAHLEPGMVAMTTGYHNPNDGGAGVYTIRDKGADTPDGGSIIEIPGTDYVAELITGGTVNIKQFGAKGDGLTDDTQAIQNASEYCYAKGCILFISHGTYMLSNSITVYNGMTIVGANKYTSTLKRYSRSTTEKSACLKLVNLNTAIGNEIKYLHIKNLGLTGIDNIYDSTLSDNEKTIGILCAADGAAYCSFEDLLVMNCDIGVHFPLGTWCCRFINHKMTCNDRGLYIEKAGHGNRIENIVVNHTSVVGIDVVCSNYSSFSNFFVEGALGGTAVRIAWGDFVIDGIGCELSQNLDYCFEFFMANGIVRNMTLPLGTKASYTGIYANNYGIVDIQSGLFGMYNTGQPKLGKMYNLQNHSTLKMNLDGMDTTAANIDEFPTASTTSNNSKYVPYSGISQAKNESTETTIIPATTSGHLYEAINYKTVLIDFTAKFTNNVAAWTKIAQLDDGYYPKYNIQVFARGLTSGSFVTLQITNTGEVTTREAISSGETFAFSVSYLIA